ncbi:hypothetical protein [Vibrio coralliilyticus]|uniref:hypothetical protein n=1 Tax=Vibrio coralliilyticus TaxID=190893 RepID=UPI00301E5AF7
MPKISAPSVSLLDLYTGEERLPLYKTNVVVSGGKPIMDERQDMLFLMMES